MSIALVVTREFASYRKGEQITDSRLIQEIRASSNHANVVPVHVPDATQVPPQT